MEQNKKLFWLEYTICGRFCSPLLMTQPFEVIGFQSRWNSWYPGIPEALEEEILPEIEVWRPDIVLFWMGPAYSKPLIGEEPREWVVACDRIRKSGRFRHTRLMAFLGFEHRTMEQEAVWRMRYDLYTTGHLRIIEHGRVAKRLVGEKVQGFEGVNYYLNHNGHWEIYLYLLGEKTPRKARQPDAMGEFAHSPRTRVLTVSPDNGYEWVADGMLAETPTSIVYIVKSPEDWQRDQLSAVERERLNTLADDVGPGHQLLVGANEALLEMEIDSVAEVLRQVTGAGGWQVFINEHMWFEKMPGMLFNEIVYEGKRYTRWEYPFVP